MPHHDLDKAIEIMENIENKVEENKPEENTVNDNSKKENENKDEEKYPLVPTPGPSGIKFQFSIDAFMSGDSKKQSAEKTTVLKVEVNIPYIWDVPVIGWIAKKIFRNVKGK